jgi:hypothetical protein
MSHRCIAVVFTVIAVVALTPMFAAAQSTVLSRTPWGAPDLQGVWDFRTVTPLERPDEFEGKEFLTDEEATEFEQKLAATRVDRRPDEGNTGTYNQFWFDRGTSVVSDRRTSLIVDPPDGKIPTMTQAAIKRKAAMERARGGAGFHEVAPGGFVEDLGPGGLQLRCITGFNSGPPMTPAAYNNNVQLFQTEDYVVLLNEMNHNARIVPLDGRTHVDLQQWTGDSRGHWEGDTLVVETTNFLRETSFMRGGASKHLHLVERFTRVFSDTLVYEAAVDDPTTWTSLWTYEVPMTKSPDPLYEYACHEGNYGLYNILAGARVEEAAAESVTQGSK